MIKKLSLKEARYENKMKVEKNNNKENKELNLAESFINKYNQIKYSNKSIQEFDNIQKNKINHILNSNQNEHQKVENEARNNMQDSQKLQINKIYIGIDELKSNNNIKIINNKNIISGQKE